MTSTTKPYKNSTYPRRAWTKEEIKNLIVAWPTKSASEMEVMFQRPFTSIQFVVSALRREGVKLERKTSSGWGISRLVKEVVEGQ